MAVFLPMRAWFPGPVPLTQNRVHPPLSSTSGPASLGLGRLSATWRAASTHPSGYEGGSDSSPLPGALSGANALPLDHSASTSTSIVISTSVSTTLLARRSTIRLLLYAILLGSAWGPDHDNHYIRFSMLVKDLFYNPHWNYAK